MKLTGLDQAMFAEGFGTPALGSGFISNAATFAQSLGLHKERTDVDAHSSPEALRETWLFWAVYCCDKRIAQRSGRPAVWQPHDLPEHH
jgi:hypothetical protein